MAGEDRIDWDEICKQCPFKKDCEDHPENDSTQECEDALELYLDEMEDDDENNKA